MTTSRRTPMSLVLFAIVSAASACDAGTEETPTGGDGGAETFVPPEVETEYTDWPKTDQGTTAKPKYNNGCRYFAVDGGLYESATNGLTDDRLTVSGPPEAPVSATIAVDDGAGVVLEASLVFEEFSLLGKAYHLAGGTVSWGRDPETEGIVVDGTLCFEAKLEAGTAVSGELSIIAEGPGGAYTSIGGYFELYGAAITSADPIDNADPIEIDATGISIDLR